MSNRATRLFYQLLENIETGWLVVKDSGSSRQFGDFSSKLRSEITINNPCFYSRVLSHGSLGLGESYMDGWWEAEGDNLTSFIGILLSNKLEQRVRGNLALRLRLLLHYLLTSPRRMAAARRCIEHHYDIGNEFFQLFLDPSMAYSCGYQLTPDDSLAAMQQQKYELVAKKLGVEKGGRLLDIGCGWGGMLLHAAKSHGVRGTGVTLSQRQSALAKQLIEEARLRDKLDISLCDYRTISGSYDYIVSIGMFEHVGQASYPVFMRQIERLLKPGGTGLLHTIGCTDDSGVKTDPWIAKYIFPGGSLPRLDQICREMRKAGLLIAHIENLKLHYAETLHKWRENFVRHRGKIAFLDNRYDQRFLRMWDYYLQCCEAAFRHSTLQLYQILFCREDTWPLPRVFDFALAPLTEDSAVRA